MCVSMCVCVPVQIEEVAVALEFGVRDPLHPPVMVHNHHVVNHVAVHVVSPANDVITT